MLIDCFYYSLKIVMYNNISINIECIYKRKIIFQGFKILVVGFVEVLQLLFCFLFCLFVYLFNIIVFVIIVFFFVLNLVFNLFNFVYKLRICIDFELIFLIKGKD